LQCRDNSFDFIYSSSRFGPLYSFEQLAHPALNDPVIGRFRDEVRSHVGSEGLLLLAPRLLWLAGSSASGGRHVARVDK
jgi:hypothetical protein